MVTQRKESLAGGYWGTLAHNGRIIALLTAGILLISGFAGAAAFSPVPIPPLPPAVTWAFEPNRGQSDATVQFLLREAGLGFARDAIFYTGALRLQFLRSNPAAEVSLQSPQQGLVNHHSGPDASKWVTGIPRFGAARIGQLYRGVDVEYLLSPSGGLTLRFLLRAGVSLEVIGLQVPAAVRLQVDPNGLRAYLGLSRLSHSLDFGPLVATQSGIVREAQYRARSANEFGFEVASLDPAQSLSIDVPLLPEFFVYDNGAPPLFTRDSAGNWYVARTVADASGRPKPFADHDGCGMNLWMPSPCVDVAIYKLSPPGGLVFVTYLAGRTSEHPSFIGLAPGNSAGPLVVTGTTDSADFPVSSGALQQTFAGPAAQFELSPGRPLGDLFAARLDQATGVLQVSTYLGGPQGDRAGTSSLGTDGSIYFLPEWLGTRSGGMPVHPGAFRPLCQSDPCIDAYAARLSPTLDRLLLGTYIPGVQATARLHTDGSIYFAGRAGPGFPVTANAYQQQSAGGEDGVVGRLDPSGSRLIFGTYIGGPLTDWILRMAVSPDGSVWAHVSSFVQCCTGSACRLVRIDASGQRLLADMPIDVGDIAVDREGNLLAIAAGRFRTSPDAPLEDPCGQELAYVKWSPAGEQLFASYLPYGTSTDFAGTSPRGLPILTIRNRPMEVIESASAGVYTGCVLDAASFTNGGGISPGQLITLFGTHLGPREGLASRPGEDGRLPRSLGGTRVLINGEPVPLLFVSYRQINAIVPFSLPGARSAVVQVETGGERGNELELLTQDASVTLFTMDPSVPSAAALNEDGTVNSRANPAAQGSRVALYGTGGGVTIPPSEAGTITPLELRRLAATPQARVNGVLAEVEFAGAAPGLAAGVVQINIRLPLLPGVAGAAEVQLFSPGASFSSPASIFLRPVAN